MEWKQGRWNRKKEDEMGVRNSSFRGWRTRAARGQRRRSERGLTASSKRKKRTYSEGGERTSAFVGVASLRLLFVGGIVDGGERAADGGPSQGAADRRAERRPAAGRLRPGAPAARGAHGVVQAGPAFLCKRNGTLLVREKSKQRFQFPLNCTA